MSKLNSATDLLRMYENTKDLLVFRHQEKPLEQCDQFYIAVCGVAGCESQDSLLLVERLNHYIELYQLQTKVEVGITGCFGFCEQGPIVKIYPDQTFYVKVKPEDAERIIQEHILKRIRLMDRIYHFEGQPLPHQEHIPFYRKQIKIALRNCGLINPNLLGEAIAAKAYQGLAKCLFEMTPSAVIETISASGLRGRGGAGFPTGTKWALAAKEVSSKKYVICNADEGDPGAFMDRSILEGDPHSILEAMAIAGYAIGSNEGNIYIRAEYPLAVKTLRLAIAQAKEYGLLGERILGSDFSFDIHIKYGAGAFVCGEETALIHSIEGKRGEPTVKPPFPSVSGLYQKPTIVNNVETLATIPYILTEGVSAFRQFGTEKSKGTKVFALAGKVNNVGLVEVPIGMTLHDVIFDIGGGIRNDKTFKAAQTGGPSGGCLAQEDLDTPIDFDTLTARGSMMGSGGLIVMDEENCMVDIAKFYLDFTVEESCGKCTPCRIGNHRMLEILEKITNGKGTIDDLHQLRALAENIKDSALCGLGQTSPNPVLSTLNKFYDEYLAHVVDRKCPAGVCKHLLSIEIEQSKCLGCGKCVLVCPVGAIVKTATPAARNPRLNTFMIDQGKCIKCEACIPSCPSTQVIIRR